jgi:hypothetical protein
MGLANKSVVPVDEDSSRFPDGPFYVSWYDGEKKKHMDPVGRDPEHALRMANLKRAALAYISAGGEIKNTKTVQNADCDSAEVLEAPGKIPRPQTDHDAKGAVKSHAPFRDRKTVSAAISEYLEDCLDRQGKSGYGLASRTREAYEYRLGFLAEFRPKAFLDEVDDQFLKAFRRFLREHSDDLSDRTCYNIIQAVSTFLLRNGISAAKPILKEMSFPPTVVIP